MRKVYVPLQELWREYERDFDDISDETLDKIIWLMNTAYNKGGNDEAKKIETKFS